MKGFNIFLLFTTAVLVAAHPHPLDLGECMEMRSAARGSRSLWFSHEFDCIKEIEPSREEVLARKVCKTKTRRFVRDFFKDDKIDFPKDTNVDDVTSQRDLFYANCMVERLDLVSQNGSLNTEKIMKSAAKMSSKDSDSLLLMHTWMKVCIATLNDNKEMVSTKATTATTTTTTTTKTTTTTTTTSSPTSTTTTTTTASPLINATISTNKENSSVAAEQYMEMRSCVQQMLREHCEQEKLLVKEYLHRTTQKSECANIGAYTGVIELGNVFGNCFSSIFKPSTDPVGSTKGEVAMPQVVTFMDATICTMKKMNWYSLETGIDMLNYTKYMSNFTGWKEHPQILSNLTSAMNTCLTNYTGDVYAQFYNWNFCLKPAVIDICGFNNNVTKFIFPFLAKNIGTVAKEYMNEMMDMNDADEIFSDDVDYDYSDTEDGGDDMYDIEDDKTREEKAEMVDDGLYVKGALLAAHKDQRTSYNDDDDDDSDVETVTESEEHDDEKVKEQLKRGSSPLKESDSAETTGDKRANATKKSDSEGEKSSETTDFPGEIPDTSTEDDFLL